jgi:hypothetical protein
MGCGASTEPEKATTKTSTADTAAKGASVEMTEEEKRQVQEILARKPKQSILSTSNESMTHYKSATFHIDDDDAYYKPVTEVKVREEPALRRTSSVLKRPSKADDDSPQSPVSPIDSTDDRRRSSSESRSVKRRVTLL